MLNEELQAQIDDFELREITEFCKGYKCTADTPHKKEMAFRWINRHYQALYVNKIIVDSFTASHVVSILDNLNAENKAKYLEFDLVKMAKIAFTLLNKVGQK